MLRINLYDRRLCIRNLYLNWSFNITFDRGDDMGCIENLKYANESLISILPYLDAVGVSPQIKALVAKTIYKNAGIILPFEIPAASMVYDILHIAKTLNIYTGSGKPAENAVSSIIKQLNIVESEKQLVWESNGSWQGTVTKYTESAIDKIEEWLMMHEYPQTIEAVNASGKKVNYKVYYNQKKEKKKRGQWQQLNLFNDERGNTNG